MKTKIIIIICSLLIVSGVSFGVYHYISNKNETTKEEKTKKETPKTYEESPDYVKNAYNMIDPLLNTDNYSILKGMYQNKLVTSNTLSDESKVSYLIKRIYNDGYFNNILYYKIIDIDTNELESIIKEEAKKIEKESDLPYSDLVLEKYPSVKKEVFKKYALDLLGDSDIELSTVLLLTDEKLIACEYEDKDEYDCSSTAGGGTGPRAEYARQFEKYEEKDNELIIYDKSLFFIDTYGEEVEDEYRYYFKDLDSLNNAYDEEESMVKDEKELVTKKIIKDINSYDKINKEVLKENGILYKSIFRKNDSGKYYWISSEPVK